MANSSQEPGKFDAVKGGQVPPPISGAVLGGIEGLRQRFATGNEQIRLDTVTNASTYGDEALDILVKALRGCLKSILQCHAERSVKRSFSRRVASQYTLKP
ncbi:hypothetical protein CAL7716_096080 [Calothrix sp. PCC 7716]|nr:hypothetical protein CAL7716_096080 [Calothrix sp. PCC 7716]